MRLSMKVSVTCVPSSVSLLVITSGIDSSGSYYGPVVGSCEHDDEPSCSTNGVEFLDSLSDFRPLNDAAQWTSVIFNSPFLRLYLPIQSKLC